MQSFYSTVGKNKNWSVIRVEGPRSDIRSLRILDMQRTIGWLAGCMVSVLCGWKMKIISFQIKHPGF